MMSVDEAIETLEMLTSEEAAGILEQVSTEKVKGIIEHLDVEKAIQIAELMKTDKLAQVLEITSTQRAVEVLEGLSVAKATNITVELTPVTAAAIMNEIVFERAVEIVKTGISGNLTSKIANLTLSMNSTKAASVLVEVNVSISAPLTETMVEINVTGAAEIVEDAAELNLEEAVVILEHISSESSAELLIEISRLPSTPETAAKLLDAMSTDKALEIVRLIIDMNALKELGEVFSYLSTDRLNEIFEASTLDERAELLPYLTQETVERISTELLPFPDLTLTSIESIPSELVTEEECKVKITVKNVGNVDAEKFYVKLEANSVEIQILTIEKLAVNESETLIFNWRPMQPDIYTLKAIVCLFIHI